MNPEGAKKTVTTIIFAIIILIAIFSFSPFSLVGPGERGVVVRLGAVQDKVLGEGLHFKVPMMEKIEIIDVKTQKVEVDAPSFSKDLQNVDTRIALNYHLDPATVQRLLQEIGSDYEFRVIAPAIQESVKSATAQFTAAELVSERPKVKDAITKALTERLHPRHILVDDFSIVNFDFSDAYEHAVEEKQVAQQNALKAENDLRRITIEADQRVAQAKGEAEAIRIQSAALKENQDLIKLEAVKKWNGELPNYMLSGGTLPFLDLGKQ
ncbi:prohibitin family protein [bacterium]|nr:prohibitin family protein [bacterium]